MRRIVISAIYDAKNLEQAHGAIRDIIACPIKIIRPTIFPVENRRAIMGNFLRIITEVVMREHLEGTYQENAYAHIESIRSAIDLVPISYRDSAVVEINSWHDHDGFAQHVITVCYDRPPTKDEINQQIATEHARIAKEIEWFQRRGMDLLREAAVYGYQVPDWPFKPEMPASSEEG